MTAPHLELAQRWLVRAEHDIITAKQTLHTDLPITSVLAIE